MFNFDGLFSMLFAVAAFVGGVVLVALKLGGVLLLSWGWVAAPFILAFFLILLAASRS